MSTLAISDECRDPSYAPWSLVRLAAAETTTSNPAAVRLGFRVSYLQHVFQLQGTQTEALVYAAPGAILEVTLQTGRFSAAAGAREILVKREVATGPFGVRVKHSPTNLSLGVDHGGRQVERDTVLRGVVFVELSPTRCTWRHDVSAVQAGPPSIEWSPWCEVVRGEGTEGKIKLVPTGGVWYDHRGFELSRAKLVLSMFALWLAGYDLPRGVEACECTIQTDGMPK